MWFNHLYILVYILSIFYIINNCIYNLYILLIVLWSSQLSHYKMGKLPADGAESDKATTEESLLGSSDVSAC